LQVNGTVGPEVIGNRGGCATIRPFHAAEAGGKASATLD